MPVVFDETWPEAAGTEISSTGRWVQDGTDASGKISAAHDFYFDTTGNAEYHNTTIFDGASGPYTLEYPYIVEATATDAGAPAVGLANSISGGSIILYHYAGVLSLTNHANSHIFGSATVPLAAGSHAIRLEITPGGGPGGGADNCSIIVKVDGTSVFTAAGDGSTFFIVDMNRVILYHIGTLDDSTATTGHHIGEIKVTTSGSGGGSPATTYTATPDTSSIPIGVGDNITLIPNGAYTGNVTLTSTDSGATFSPSNVVTWTGDNATKLVSYTPSTLAGSPHVISFTNSGSLTDPASVDITVLDVIDGVLIGDSFVVNVGFGPPIITDVIQACVGPTYFIFMKGVGGQTIANCTSRISTDVIPNCHGTNNFVAILAGNNNLGGGGQSGATAYAELIDFATTLRADQATAGLTTLKFFVFTLPEWTSNAEVADFNNRIITQVDPLWDDVIPLHLDDTFGTARFVGNTTVSTGLHPNNFSIPLIGRNAATVITRNYNPVLSSFSAADVRSGVALPNGGGSGTCHVPAAGNVLLGIAVDATTGTGAGPGANATTLTFTSNGSTPIVNATVWVSSDSAGLIPISAPLVTNGSGQAVFQLTTGGTYYANLEASGYRIRNQSFTA